MLPAVERDRGWVGGEGGSVEYGKMCERGIEDGLVDGL